MRPSSAGRHRAASYFNPRTPVGCDATPTPVAGMSTFQSTHPSGVRPPLRGSGLAERVISIHAPQWGATTQKEATVTKLSISIHTPQWGATTTNSQSEWRSTHFNPRTPVGCDGGRRHVRTEGHISIHAPQWGATSGLSRPTRGRQYFNPRTPVGCDATCGSRRNRSNRFQSTHPSGVRRSCRCD